MLITANATADDVRHSYEFHHLRAIGVEAGSIIADLKSCRKKFSLPRKTVKDTRESWFGADSDASSVVNKVALRNTVRMSDVVGVGDVQYNDKHPKLGLAFCSRFLPSPTKKEPSFNYSLWCQKSVFQFQINVPVVLHSKLPWRNDMRNQERQQEMPQFSKKVYKLHLYLCIYDDRHLHFSYSLYEFSWMSRLFSIWRMSRKRANVQGLSSKHQA